MSDNQDPVIDFCVLPPLRETLEGFADPSGPFAKYSALYAREASTALIQEVTKNPVGFLLGLMDDAGVDIVVLTAEDAETTMGMKVPNEKVAALVRQCPDRFIGMAAVDPHKGMQGLRELEFAVKDLGMKGVCLEPWLHKIHSNDKLYYPIYAKCVELDVPVWIHTSVNFVPQLTIDFGRPIYLDEAAGHFPELTIVAGHGGWPWVNELMAVLWRHDNVFADIGAIRPRYIGTPGSGWETLLRYGDTILQDKIVFSTAWPAQDFKTSIAEIRQLPIKDGVKRKWLGGNASKILKLE
jgi:predicted TIM-barrel fold metal-dependent hydrolase